MDAYNFTCQKNDGYEIPVVGSWQTNAFCEVQLSSFHLLEKKVSANISAQFSDPPLGLVGDQFV